MSVPAAPPPALIAVGERALQTLRRLEREAQDAAHAAQQAMDAASDTRGRAAAVREALGEALQVPPGYVLDLEHGAFLAPPGQHAARP